LVEQFTRLLEWQNQSYDGQYFGRVLEERWQS